MGKCTNGCDAPICPPSKVICRACMDKITRDLRQILADALKREAERASSASEERG